MANDEALREWLEARRRCHQSGRAHRPDAVPLSQPLERLASSPWFARRRDLKDVLAAWPAAAGETAAAHSEIRGVKNGVLHVVVDSAVHLHEMANFRKKEILAALVCAKGCSKIHDVEFKLGKLERE
jgi:hypothetical protein